MAERLKRAGELYKAHIHKLVAKEENNNRVDYGDIEALATSIEVNGLLKPLKVKHYVVDGEDVFEVVDGFRRTRAIKLLVSRGHSFPLLDGMPYVKVETTLKMYNDDDALFEQIISNDGKPLTPLEEGSVYKKLILNGFSETEISERTGRNITTVRNNIAIASLPKVVQNMIAENTVSGLTAIKVAQEVNYNEEKLVEALKAALNKASEDFDNKVEKGLPIQRSKPRVTDRFVDVLNKQNPAKSFKKILALEKILTENKIDNVEVSLFKKVLAYANGEIEMYEILENFMGEGNVDLVDLGEETIITFEKSLENQTVNTEG